MRLLAYRGGCLLLTLLRASPSCAHLHCSRFQTYTAGLAYHIRSKSLRDPDPLTRQLAAASLFSILSGQGGDALEVTVTEEIDSLVGAKDSKSVHGTLLLLAEVARAPKHIALNQAVGLLVLQWLPPALR